MSSEIMLLQGNEACVKGALKAGMRFFAGYPITPSTEIAELSSQYLPLHEGKFIQMEDEIASMAAVIGASLTGTKSMTATSGPGFSLKQENIGFASMAEVPCVIVNVQRGGPSTGLPTSPSQGDVMQAKWGTHGDHPIIALTPSSVREVYDLTIQSFNLSEKYRVPVILLMDEMVAHMREKVEIDENKNMEIVERKKPSCEKEKYIPYKAEEGLVPSMANFGEGFNYHVTGLAHNQKGFQTNDTKIAGEFLERLNKKISDSCADIVQWEEQFTDDCELLVIAYGGISRSAKSAMKKLRKQGKKVGFFRPITIWPFPEQRLKELSKKVDSIIVAEMNLGQIKSEVERICGIEKVSGVNKINGEVIYPEEIIDAVYKEDTFKEII